MVDLKDLSVDTRQGVDRAKLVFDREGILVAKNLLPAEVVRTAADFLRDAVTEIDRTVRQYGFSLQDADAAERLTALMENPRAEISEHDRHMFLGHFPLDVRLAEPLRTIPRVLNGHRLLFELLSAQQLFAHMPPTARYVLPRCSLARVPLHQDISYNRHMGDFCVVWVPLVPIDLACGGMAAYGWLAPIDSGSADDAQRVVLAPLEPGDVVVMGKGTMHESMPNSSDRMRLSCDFRFFGEQSHSTKHYLDIAT